MNSSNSLLLRQIIENPDDHCLRAIYADALLTSGEKRGEFISSQLRLKEPSLSEDERHSLLILEGSLLAQYQSAWKANARLHDFMFTQFTNGFIEKVSMVFTRKKFAALERAFGYREPIRHLRIIGANARERKYLKLIPESEHIRYIHSLDISWGKTSSIECADIFNCVQNKNMLGVHELELSGNVLECHGVEALANLSSLSGLKRLSVGSNSVRELGAKSIAKSSKLIELETLSLSNQWLSQRFYSSYANKIGDAGLWALGASKKLSKLRNLRIADNGIGPQGVRAFVAEPMLCRLEELDLSRNPIQSEGAIALANHSAALRLKSLSLSHCCIGLDGLKAILESPFLINLQRIDMRANPFIGGISLAIPTERAKIFRLC